MSASTLSWVMPGTSPTTAKTAVQQSGVNCISPGTPPPIRTGVSIGGVPPGNAAGVKRNGVVSSAAISPAISDTALVPVSGRQMCVLTPRVSISTRKWPEFATPMSMPHVPSARVQPVGSQVIS